MTINQLFKKKVPYDIIEKLLVMLNIHDINNAIIDKNNINNEFLNKFELLKVDIKNYYVNSKQTYFDVITDNKIITILKQLLKLYNYKLVSKEKLINNKRTKIYQIINNNNTNIIYF